MFALEGFDGGRKEKFQWILKRLAHSLLNVNAVSSFPEDLRETIYTISVSNFLKAIKGRKQFPAGDYARQLVCCVIIEESKKVRKPIRN